MASLKVDFSNDDEQIRKAEVIGYRYIAPILFAIGKTTWPLFCFVNPAFSQD